MSDFSVDAGIELDGGSLNRIAAQLADAITSGMTQAAKEISKRLDVVFKGMQDNLKKITIDDSLAKTTAKVTENAAKLKAEISGAGDQQQKLLDGSQHLEATLRAISKVKYVDPQLFALAAQNIEKLQRLTKEIRTTDFSNPAAKSAVNAEFETLRRNSLDSLKIITRVSDQAAKATAQGEHARTLTVEREGRAQQTLLVSSEAQKLVAVKQAAKEAVNADRAGHAQRIARTQAFYSSLLQIERGSIALISGAAKTGVSAIGKVWDVTLGQIGRTVKQKYETINQTTKSSLNQNETILSSSLKKEERLYRESLSRQERLVTTANKRISTGITGAITGRGIGGGLATLGGGIAIGKLIADGFNEAKNAVESTNKAAVVFGKSFEGIRILGENSAKAMGLTKSEALDAAATFGNLFRALGSTEGSSAFLSAGLTQLGADLASFNNTSLEEALTAIRSGLVGETEPLRKFGVNLNDATLKAKALEMGLYLGKGNLDAYARSQAAIALIYEQTTLAQGDFKRTAGETANQLKIAGASIKNFFGAILANILPAVKVGLNGFTSTLDVLTKFVRGDVSGALKTVRLGLIGVGEGLLAILAAKAAIEVLQLAGTALTALTSPMGLVIVAAGVLGGLFNILRTNSKEFADTVTKVKDRVIELGGEGFTKLKEGASIAGDFLAQVGKAAAKYIGVAVDWIGDFLPKALKFARDEIERLKPVVATVFGFLEKVAGAALEKLQPVIKGVKTAIDFVETAVSSVASTIRSKLNSDGGGAGGGGGGRSFFSALAIGAKVVFDEVKERVTSAIAFIVERFKKIDWGNLAKGALDFVGRLGYIVGRIASDPRLITALAGIAAAAVVVGAKFLLGFAQGVIENLPELGSLGLKIAQAVIDGVYKFSGAATFPILFSALLLGPAFVKIVKEKMKGAGRAAGTGFVDGLNKTTATLLNPEKLVGSIRASTGAATKNLGAIGSTFGVAVKNGMLPEAAIAGRLFVSQLGNNIKNSFKSAGQSAGLTVGQQIGSTIVAGITSALSGQQLGKGDVVGGLLGIGSSSLAGFAAGGLPVAAAVAGIGLVSAAFSSSAESAKKAAAKTKEFRDALIEAGNVGAEAGRNTFISDLKDQAPGVAEALNKVGFSINDLVAAAGGNTGPISGILNQLKSAAEDGAPKALQAFVFLGRELKGFEAGAKGAAATQEILNHAVGGSTGVMAFLAKGATDAARGITAAGDRYTALAASVASNAKTTALDAVYQRSSDAKDALQKANEELYKLLNPDAGTFQSALDGLTLQLPGIADQIKTGLDLGGALGGANIDTAVSGLKTAIADASAQGVKDGLTADQIKKNIADLTIPIGELDVPQSVKDTLNATLYEAVTSNAIDLTVQANTENVNATVGIIAEIVRQAFKDHPTDSSGEQITNGLIRGMKNKAQAAADAASAIAKAISAAAKAALVINSPSKVFEEIGGYTIEGLQVGMTKNSGKVIDVATGLGVAIGDATANGIRIATIRASDALKSMIDDLKSQIASSQLDVIGKTLAGNATLDAAQSGFGGDLKSITEKAAAIAESIKKKEGGSFALSGADGLDNRSMFSSAVEDIKKLGETLFSSGKSITEVTDQLSFMRQALIDTGTNAGFSASELTDLISNLGLSTSAIGGLASATAEAQQRVIDAAKAEEAKKKAEEDAAAADEAAKKKADAAAQLAEDRKLTIINNLTLPYGDMEAVALHVTNRQAAQLGRRVR